MARIELKHLTIRLVDGFRATADVDDTPANGDTSVDIDNFVDAGEAGVAIPPVGTRFEFDGIDKRYTVTGVTPASSNEVQTLTYTDAAGGSITLEFTGISASVSEETGDIAYPTTAAAIYEALVDLPSINSDDVAVTGTGPFQIEFKGQYSGLNPDALVVDDTNLTGGGGVEAAISAGTPVVTNFSIAFTPALATADGIPSEDDEISFIGRSLEIKVGDGNLTWTQAKERIYDRDRGVLDTVRDGEQQPLQVSLNFVYEFLSAITGSGTPTPMEVLDKIGEASDWLSSDFDDPCAPYCVDIEVDVVKPCVSENERYTFPHFRYESTDPDVGEAQIAVAGGCNVERPTIVRI
jgi:hypothetical protein